jgi:hypothetical protein
MRRCSAVVTPGRWPASTSACRAQVRSNSGPTPSCRAIRVITPTGWPVCSMVFKTIRTARFCRSRERLRHAELFSC